MYKILLSLIFSFFFSTISYAQEPFEGVITYKVETTLKRTDHAYNDYYASKYGDTIIKHIHKNGNIKREYLNSGKNGFD